ncbi:hypothetical protein KSD_73220 [Ktedonobacter sp. SOSP1-85]|uniref:serine/threonine-protein kinase n=1 Tax=Ktedonobacter sp. SOSP1-85 TaxID=2778367 RepID=UPI0019160C01|nr:serine/threonine-protein kinase [Ktedonobacter sp. SOSP1-85]GHO79551.1 hypothetical protein KSD_73220 [Ktedonobacter sp. SOSP1-85]
MEKKPSWIESPFGHKPAKQANTPPLAPPVLAEDGVPADWKVGDCILNEFDVTGIIGKGGMGTVYKINYHPWLSIDLIVKSPRPEIFAGEGGKENFIREAETWMGLRAHPHLVSCYFVRRLGGIPRIFAAYIDGGSLADWIRQRKLYEGGLEQMLDIAIQFAWGLHAAHEQGLVHQDVKPANVMLTAQGIAKVTDFGLARARAMTGKQEIKDKQAHQSILVSSRGMTPAYCSPEQVAGQKLSRKTDIWSWGLSVLEMFTGEVTWRIGAAAREALAEYKGQDPAIPMMPADLVDLLTRCFQMQPERRPATMLEVATELQAIYTRAVGRPYSREMPETAEQDVAILVNRGLFLAELGRPEEALAAYEQAIYLDPNPNHSSAYYYRGLALRNLGRPEEALVSFEQVIRLYPNYALAYYGQGLILQDLGRLEEALAAYEQAIRLGPNNADVYLDQGVVLQELGRLEEALAAYEQAIRLGPNNARAYYNHYNQGTVLQALGQFKEALAAYERAIRLNPNDADAYYNQGNVHQELRQLEEAEQAFRKARALRSQS